ncbi:hypothetical protein L7F22_016512 [Adiantum nelumboides]|nr:hypothetical protein [Adiantum nelumboides]
MKRKLTGRSTDIYNFDEGDVETFSAKRVKIVEKKKLFQSSFKSGIGGRKNESNKRKNTTQKPKKSMFSGDIFAKETNANQSLSVSDAIEEARLRRAVGVSTRVFRDEEPVAEECKEVGIQGEELWFSDQKYSSPELKFTAAAIELKGQAVRLFLSVLQNFSSGSHEEGPFFIKLDLTEDGAKFLQQHLGYSDDCTSCSTIYCTFLDKSFLAEKIKQITSLSDGYKRKWKPGIDHVRHHKEKFVNIIHTERDGFNDGGSDHSFGDCILYRSEGV